jgi:hypothetical protein
LIHSFLDETQKRDELERFDRSYAEFERAQAAAGGAEARALLKAASLLRLKWRAA